MARQHARMHTFVTTPFAEHGGGGGGGGRGGALALRVATRVRFCFLSSMSLALRAMNDSVKLRVTRPAQGEVSRPSAAGRARPRTRRTRRTRTCQQQGRLKPSFPSHLCHAAAVVRENPAREGKPQKSNPLPRIGKAWLGNRTEQTIGEREGHTLPRRLLPLRLIWGAGAQPNDDWLGVLSPRPTRTTTST